MVLTGDASPQGLHAISQVIQRVFGDIQYSQWLKDTLDPGYTLAIGAALKAKYVAHRPEDFGLKRG